MMKSYNDIREYQKKYRKEHYKRAPLREIKCKCGKMFSQTHPLQKYCSKYCSYHHKKDYGEAKCYQCGEKFRKKNASNVFCSNNCRQSMRYKDITNIDSYREFVFERDNWTCQKCGIVAKRMTDLNAHHIIPIYKGGNPGVDNMQTLCEKCHKKEHKVW